MSDKIDSNSTGLRFAEEATLKTLPGSGGVDAVWYPLEPNSYKDFRGQISTTARNPINPSRQRKKGVVTDLDASGGFVQDLTATNLDRLAQGAFYADVRQRPTTAPMNTPRLPVTSVGVAGEYNVLGGGVGGFKSNAIMLATGFALAINNGLKTLSASAANKLTVNEPSAVEAFPPAGATLTSVGFKHAAAALSMTLNGNLVRLLSAGAIDFTTFAYIPGEWIYVGGDAAGTSFANSFGFARISVVTATYLEFDKTDWEPVAEAGTGISLHLYTGSIQRNEKDKNLIKRRTYSFERTVGDDLNGTMSEYLVGSVINELTINIPQADKVTCDFGIIALDNEQRGGAVGVKPGTRPTLVDADAFNTSNDFTRIKLALVSEVDSSPLPLFGYATDITLTLKNNASALKAVGVLGAFNTSTGTFEVGGKLTAYFSDLDAVIAVRQNLSATYDCAMVKDNKGLLFDIPLMSLGDGSLTIEQDKPIMVPIEKMAAESKFGYTFQFQNFPYLPVIAGE